MRQHFPGLMSEDLDLHEIETYVTVSTPEFPVIEGAMAEYFDEADPYTELNFD